MVHISTDLIIRDQQRGILRASARRNSIDDLVVQPRTIRRQVRLMLREFARTDDPAHHGQIARLGVLVELVEANVGVAVFGQWVVGVVAGVLVLLEVGEHVVLHNYSSVVADYEHGKYDHTSKLSGSW